MEAIRINGLTKRYKDAIAVDGLELTVHGGELFALLGVNGAGKSTAVRMLSCLTAPTSGDAFICGHSIVSEGEQVKEIIGVSPQETAIAPNLTVRENLELICSAYSLGHEAGRAKIEVLASELGLGEVMERRAGKLSGGWQRRLSIAMALIGEPSVLFLDEPTLGLDVLARAELWETVRRLKEKMTVILTTHYMEEAEALSDRVGIMVGGRLVAVGTAEELKASVGADRFEDAFIKIVRGAKE